MRVYELRIGNEDESVGVCVAFLQVISIQKTGNPLAAGLRTHFSQFSQRHSSTAFRIALRSPKYTATHQTTTNTLTALSSRRKLQSPLLTAAHCLSTSGFTLYSANARATRHAWCVRLSGSEYAPTGMP